MKRRGTVTNQTGGSGAGSQAFPYLCSDGSRTRCLLWKDITLRVLAVFFLQIYCMLGDLVIT